MPIGPDTHNEKGVKTRYPVEEGLTAETTKQTKVRGLIPQVKSNIPARLKRGID